MSFFAELRRRNVIRVGIAYAAVAWLLAQIADLALGAFGVADWALRGLLIALLVGLPIALILAWVYELTPQGIRVDTDGVSDAAPAAERRLNRIIVGVLTTAIVFLLVDKFYIDRKVSTETGDAQSLVVLPFVNMPDDEDYFADGLSEELLNRLARTPDLRVSARTSSFAYKDQQEDLREIGKALGVEHVLEGSVRRSGERLRITAQLIKVSDGFHLWSETYDHNLDDIFLIQDDVSERIATALKLRLDAARDAPNIDPHAYALYLEAVALGNVPTGDIRPALEKLDKALQIDLQRAADPDQNVEYMRQWMADIAAAAEVLNEVMWAKQRLLPLGLADEYLTDLERIRTETAEFWTNADSLEFFCVVFANSGCRAHPKYTEIVRRSALPELWEELGPPDHCRKESGKWVYS